MEDRVVEEEGAVVVVLVVLVFLERVGVDVDVVEGGALMVLVGCIGLCWLLLEHTFVVLTGWCT